MNQEGGGILYTPPVPVFNPNIPLANPPLYRIPGVGTAIPVLPGTMILRVPQTRLAFALVIRVGGKYIFFKRPDAHYGNFMYEIFGGSPSMNLKVFEITSTFNQRNEYIELTSTPKYKFTIPQTQTHIYFYDSPTPMTFTEETKDFITVEPSVLMTDLRVDNQTRYIVAFLHSQLL